MEEVIVIFTVTELYLKDLMVSAERFVLSVQACKDVLVEFQCVPLGSHYVDTVSGCFCRRLHLVVAGCDYSTPMPAAFISLNCDEN